MSGPKLSGAARRKLAREAARRENYGVLARAQYVRGELTGVVVGELDSVGDWRREIGRIFREARAGTLPTEEASRLTFVASLGVRVAQVEQELRQIAALHEAVQRVEEQRHVLASPALPAPEPAGEPLTGELMPLEAPNGGGQL